MTEDKEKTLRELQQQGIAIAPILLHGVDDVKKHYHDCTVYNAHVQAKGSETASQYVAARQRDWPVFCVHMQDVVKAPHLLELMCDYYDVAKAYFEEEPVLYSMNTFWTQPAKFGRRYEDTHDWHRDGDDRKQLVLFVYGTDVDVDSDGAHLYQPGTVHIPDYSLGYHFRSPPQDRVRTIHGKAGTVFLSDTRGLHMGIRPNKLRMLAWGRWGVSTPPVSYGWDRLQPVPRALIGDRYPTDPAIAHAIRFVVQ